MEMLNVIEELEEEQDEEEQKPFVVTDLASADWVFRKIKQVKEDFAEKEAYAKEEMKKYETYLNEEKKQMEDSMLYFEKLLRNYLLEKEQDDPKFKIHTASGKASLGKEQDKWKYDEKKILAFLEESNLPEYIRTYEQKAVNKSAIKAACQFTEDGAVITPDGEILEGVTVTKERKLNIKLN